MPSSRLWWVHLQPLESRACWLPWSDTNAIPKDFLNLYCGWIPPFSSVVCFNIHLYGDFHQRTHSLVFSNSIEGFFFWSFSCLKNADFLYSLITHSLINLAKQIDFIMVHTSILQSSLCDVENLTNIFIFCFLSLSQLLIDWDPLITYSAKPASC